MLRIPSQFDSHNSIYRRSRTTCDSSCSFLLLKSALNCYIRLLLLFDEQVGGFLSKGRGDPGEPVDGGVIEPNVEGVAAANKRR